MGQDGARLGEFVSREGSFSLLEKANGRMFERRSSWNPAGGGKAS